jgi:capsular polysaccharide biosynthesis protein
MDDTRQILAGVVRRWWLVGALAALGGLVGLGYTGVARPSYVAKAYVIVVAQDQTGSTSAVSYAQAYTRIAPQGDVVDAAARRSHGAASAAQLRRQVQAASSPDTPVIEITGSARSGRRSAELANLVADSLIRTANRQSAATRIRPTLLSAAAPPADPVSPRLAPDVAVGAAVGLLLGGLAVLAGAGNGALPTPPVPPLRSARRAAVPGVAPAAAPTGRTQGHLAPTNPRADGGVDQESR